MSRALVLGNGSLLVAFDQYGQMRDLYYPYVGLENQVGGSRVHRIGIWIDGSFSWISDGGWDIEYRCDSESLVGILKAKHTALGLSLIFHDVVYNEKNIFLRKIVVKNEQGYGREIRIFFAHQFDLSGKTIETAYFEPFRHALVHYKGKRVILVNGEIDGLPFSDWSVGLMGFMGKEGTHKDAEDGVLAKNPIEHGPVDSVGAFSHFLSGGESKTLHYWLIAAESTKEALEHDSLVAEKTPEHMIETTTKYWKAWVNRHNFTFHKLPQPVIDLFKKSLMIVRAHADNRGSILASADSEMLQYGKDTYGYMWPRDASRAAITLSRSGDGNVAKRFFEFASTLITEQGFLMHKYLPDGSLGSSWHPWIREGFAQLPIQEDETAVVLYGLTKYYRQTKDLEFIESVFGKLIEPMADFLLSFRDVKTGLPKGSYDLWEEKHGTSTYTSASVYGALRSAAELCRVLGKTNHEKRYRTGAEEVREGIMKHLYNEASGNFHKLILFPRDGGHKTDSIIDMSSPHGIFNFGVLDAGDPKLKRAFENAAKKLSENIKVGGIARYEGDNYYRPPGSSAVGNPWIITTLWVAEHKIALAQTEADFDSVRETLSWVAKHALPSGVLPEQLHPETGEPLSATPLTWSHAEFANTVLKYLDRLETLGICPTCNPVS